MKENLNCIISTYFEPITFNLKKQVFTDENNKILTVEYRDYKLIENNFFLKKL